MKTPKLVNELTPALHKVEQENKHLNWWCTHAFEAYGADILIVYSTMGMPQKVTVKQAAEYLEQLLSGWVGTFNDFNPFAENKIKGGNNETS